jgi:hypothetical protein
MYWGILCEQEPHDLKWLLLESNAGVSLHGSRVGSCSAITIAPFTAGAGRIAGHAHQKIEERPVMTLEQNPQLGEVSSAHGLHECLVGHGSVVLGKHERPKKVTLAVVDELVCFLPRSPSHAPVHVLAAARDCRVRRNACRAVQFR